MEFFANPNVNEIILLQGLMMRNKFSDIYFGACNLKAQSIVFVKWVVQTPLIQSL